MGELFFTTYMVDHFATPSYDFPVLADQNNETTALGKGSRASRLNTNHPPTKIQKATKSSLTKTRAKKTSKTHKITAVTLPRETLLVTSRPEFDSFVASVSKGRQLTEEEKKEVSRQRQLIKNRKTAAISRQRKKERQERLEAQYKELTESQHRLKERLAGLETQNQQMRQEISFFENLVRSNPVASSVWEKLKWAKKQYSMASPSMIQAAKYLCLFLLFIQLSFAFSLNSSTSFQAPTKTIEWGPIVEPNRFVSETPPVKEEAIWPEQTHVPTLMPPKDLETIEMAPQYLDGGDFEPKPEKSELDIEFLDDAFFNSVSIDELLSNANGTLASFESDMESWNETMDTLIRDTGNSSASIETALSVPLSPPKFKH